MLSMTNFIESDLGLKTLTAARQIVAEVEASLQTRFPKGIAEGLVRFAELDYHESAAVRQQLRAGSEGRKHLCELLRYWLPQVLFEENPALVEGVSSAYGQQPLWLTPEAKPELAKPRIRKETGRNPLPIARSVVAEMEQKYGLHFPAGLAERMVERAEGMYAEALDFREAWLGETPRQGRKALRTFLWWWLPYTLKQMDPELWRQIPKDYLGDW